MEANVTRTERDKAARDVELSLERDKQLRQLRAIASEQLQTIFALAESSFPTAPEQRYELAKWYSMNPDASPRNILKQIAALRAANTSTAAGDRARGSAAADQKGEKIMSDIVTYGEHEIGTYATEGEAREAFNALPGEDVASLYLGGTCIAQRQSDDDDLNLRRA